MDIILENCKEKAKWLHWAIGRYQDGLIEWKRVLEYAKDVHHLTEEIVVEEEAP